MNKLIIHKETKEYIYPLSRSKVLIKAEATSKQISEITLHYWKRFRNHTKKTKKMYSLNPMGNSRYYFIELEFEDTIRYLNYIFEINQNGKTYYYSPAGVQSSFPKKYFEFQSVNHNDIFDIPTNFEGDICYHIFPERFYNGNKENDPEEVVAWDSIPTRENFMGGDFEGIKQKIHYLNELGVNTVFLTPIFKSPSNHKYDTMDYFELEPSFGSNSEFNDMVEEMSKNQIKLVLDGVFNHIGYYSDIFQDVVKNQKNSKYWDWFLIHGNELDVDKVNYECVGDYKYMPKLNTANKEVQAYFNKVGAYWILKYHVAGWRLDVGDELDFTFRKSFRQHIKSTSKQKLIMSETWHNGQDLLRGDEVDTIMNYRLRDALIDILVLKEIDLPQFNEQIESIYFDYPKQVHHILYNLLDSHDTARFLTTANEDKDILKIAAVIQFLLPGMPVIYYGDEIGMKGETDPLCRAGMTWNQVDLNIYNFYKDLIEIKKKQVFKTGDFNILEISEKVFSFIRYDENETYLVVVNPGLIDESISLKKDDLKWLELNNDFNIIVGSKSYAITKIR
ncbi:glycoside hydrolase family 13 protein [Acholeplasma laidlawii]|uniref:glycoside hydrolase family 13 protein n=1 Tax=Acholeplasma laidlawii TaxID=2148 RepID=UPI0018C24C5E|nr:glycoside hydrolase family 13 protein [Acholeplasma laidlawii]MBG0762692.1 glycoside hydrolase family 13 protein [Acholeplasma laidlawii]